MGAWLVRTGVGMYGCAGSLVTREPGVGGATSETSFPGVEATVVLSDEALCGVETASSTLFLLGLVGSQFESVSVFGLFAPFIS